MNSAPRLLPSFDPWIGDAVAAHLASRGVTIHLGASVAAVVPGGLTIADGRFVAADLALAAIGVRPCTELAAAAGVKIGVTGAIAVDDGMRTNIEGVFAAGDCAEARHVVSGKAVWYPLGDIANRQGRVAGQNLAGGRASFPGVLGTAIFKVFDLAVARTGLSLEEARQSGFDPVAVRTKAPSRARYMPNSRSIEAVVVADRRTGRLLGAQAIGSDAVDKCIDVLATAIWAGLAADDLAELDLAYAPPFSPVFAAAQVLGELARKHCQPSPESRRSTSRNGIFDDGRLQRQLTKSSGPKS